ncbi:muscle M-line assembly protein unc-89-like [Penaeus japonicus]|uniref:muscle M-line assembly protein unc-89-like n=1 Tax=Penaeus japonicus TaxID=27405 RepID=UPI001C70FAF7|nr:muscle M-line assembly protein unc-89-like [Penaeus japonicus]
MDSKDVLARWVEYVGKLYDDERGMKPEYEGELEECSKHRTIGIMSQLSKRILRVILNRIRNNINEHIPEEQCGFRKGKRTTNTIFLQRTVIERAIEMQKDLYIGFIDFEKAFDTTYSHKVTRAKYMTAASLSPPPPHHPPQERGRQSSPARASQGDDDSPMSLKAKDDRTQDLLSQRTGREQVPLETPSDEPASLRRGMALRRATSNTKRLSNRNPKKKEVEKKNKKRQDPGRRKQSPGKSNSRKKNVRKRKVEEKETKTKAKKKQRKRQNKTVKKKLKFSKNPTKKNKPVKNKAKKRKSKKYKRRKNRGGAKKPKKGQRKKGKQGVRSDTKKSKPKIKVGRTKPKPRLLFQGVKCGSSTRVGVGEVLAVEASDSGKAVECKHTIRARKGVTLKMTCPRFSLSPGGCKEEKVIREVGKGKGFKKKYCKSENPGEDVSVAAPKAVTFLHERTQQKGTRCSDGFLCLFSATEISGTVSECRKKYKLREGETMIVTPTTFRDKVSCKYSFRVSENGKNNAYFSDLKSSNSIVKI